MRWFRQGYCFCILWNSIVWLIQAALRRLEHWSFMVLSLSVKCQHTCWCSNVGSLGDNDFLSTLRQVGWTMDRDDHQPIFHWSRQNNLLKIWFNPLCSSAKHISVNWPPLLVIGGRCCISTAYQPRILPCIRSLLYGPF